MKYALASALLLAGLAGTSLAQPVFTDYALAGPVGANPGTYTGASVQSKIDRFAGIPRSFASDGGYFNGVWVGNLSQNDSWYNPDGSGVGGALNFIGQYEHTLAFTSKVVRGVATANSMATLGSTSDPSSEGSVAATSYSRVIIQTANDFTFVYSGDSGSGFQSTGSRHIFFQKNDTVLFDSMVGTGALTGEISGTVLPGDRLSFGLYANSSATTWSFAEFQNTTILSQGFGSAQGELTLGPVPEPASVSALALGLAAIVRRRARQ